MTASTSFDEFIARLGDALDARAVDGRPLTITFDPARRSPSGPREVYVGIGDWFAGASPVPHEGVCLNNKGAAQHFGWKRTPVTVASLVRDLPDDLIARWRAAFGSDPDQVLDHAVLVVEDASPDSVLSTVFWLARLAGVAPAELPQRWLTALTAWERDGIAPSVTRSWTALLSALAHSHFGTLYDGSGIVDAWGDALRFTCALMRAGADPDAVDPGASPAILADQAYGRAIAFAKNEEQDYLESLVRALRLELRVPMAGSRGRELLVDAYFATESNATSGVKKIYIRTDAQATTLGNGFSLMGLYRPGLEGTGNDMTISVDPRSGIDLKDLWHTLEAMENERWAGERPNATPRRIASYPEGGFDQPWWDDHGRYTLIGAPKRLGDGRLGSRLAWADVLEGVWRSYQPLRGLQVFDLNDPSGERKTRPLDACKARSVKVGSGPAAVEKFLVAMKWNRGADTAQSLRFTPTVKRELAAMVSKAARGSSGAIALADLVDPQDLDYLEIPGGAALVTRDGAVLFDDWRDKDLETAKLSEDFVEAVELLAAARRFDAEVDALYAAKDKDMLRRITALRSDIATTFQRADLAEAAPERRALRAALETRWGLEGKEATLTGRLKDLQEILEAKATLDTQGMATLLAFFTIPAFIGTVLQLYGLVIQETSRDSTDLDLWYYGIWMAVLLIGLSGLTVFVAFWLTRRRG